MRWGSALQHARSLVPIVGRKGRLRCTCGCKRPSTHHGMANRVALMSGCELSVRRWVRDPTAAGRQWARRDAASAQEIKP